MSEFERQTFQYQTHTRLTGPEKPAHVITERLAPPHYKLAYPYLALFI